MEISQRHERDNTLRHGMNIDGIGAVVKISDRAVLPKEVGTVEGEAALEAVFELGCRCGPANRPQGAEVVSRVEVVDPPCGRRLASAGSRGTIG